MFRQKFLACSFSLLVALVAAGLPGPAAAESVPSIAVVDINIIMRDSSAAKDLRDGMQQELEKFRQWGKGQEDKFRAEGEALQKQQTVLAQDALRQRQQDLQQKVADFQVEARRREQQIRQAGANAQQELDKVLVAVVSDVAKSEGLAMVLPKGVMIYSGDVRDITQQTLQQLNKKLPSLDIKVGK